MNSTTKDGLSALISSGGFEAYGRFWAFMELFYSMQINHSGFSTTININENTLLKQLQMNRRSLPKLLQLFSETLAIVFQKNCETYGIVYETTAPNSLIYISKRVAKNRHLELDTRNRTRKKGKSVVFSPPDIQEVEKYLNEKKYIDIDAEQWWNFYNSKNWMIGKNKMQNWKSAIATWHKKDKNPNIVNGKYTTGWKPS